MELLDAIKTRRSIRELAGERILDGDIEKIKCSEVCTLAGKVNCDRKKVTHQKFLENLFMLNRHINQTI